MNTDNLEELERLLEERAVAYCYTWAPSRALLRSLIATAREVEGLRAENERLRTLLADCPARHSMHGCPSAARVGAASAILRAERKDDE